VTPDLMTAALGLASQGVRVFPCNQNKSPRTTNGHLDATTDHETLEAWTCWDGMLGAWVPDGQIVVDIDPRNGGDNTVKVLAKVGKQLTLTRTNVTGGGGRHHYYLLDIPEGKRIRSTLGPGIDVKVPGKGYVIVPPSPGYSCSVPMLPQPAPDWLLSELLVDDRPSTGEASDAKYMTFEDGTNYGLGALERELGRLLGTLEGGRNNALNTAAFSAAQLVAGGELSEDRARQSLELAAERIGLDHSEARATIESAWRAGIESPRQAPPPTVTQRPESEMLSLDDGVEPDAEAEGRFWLDWNVEDEEQPFLCRPLLPAHAYVLVYGATEASKSMSWLGLLSEGSRHGCRSSVYSLENPAQTDRSRLKRWAPDPSNFRLTNQPLDFNDPRQVARLIEREKDWGDGRGADVLLIDTYSHAFNSRSEDGNAKAIEFARRVRHVMHAVGCTVIVIDHTGFQGDEPRDASAKRQQVDVAILMVKNGEWRPGEPARFSMTNRKAARFANPFHLSGEIRDIPDGLALGWQGDSPTWGTK
jgi:hypothetical protein